MHCYKKVSLSFALPNKGNKNIKPYSLNCIERLTKFLYPFHSHSLQTLFWSLRNTACYSFCTISSDWHRSGNEENVSYIEQYQLVYHAVIKYTVHHAPVICWLQVAVTSIWLSCEAAFTGGWLIFQYLVNLVYFLEDYFCYTNFVIHKEQYTWYCL